MIKNISFYRPLTELQCIFTPRNDTLIHTHVGFVDVANYFKVYLGKV